MIVLDNSVISAFCEIKRFHLLKEVLRGSEVVIPSTVEKEMVFDEALNSLSRGSPDSVRWIRIIEARGYGKYLGRLHSGEAGVIALAKEYGALALLDDLDARKVARGEGLRISGSLGIIKLGYERCPIKSKEELKSVLKDLKAVHFRMGEEIEKEILGTAKKRQRRHQ